jgi:hypothetical protein
MSNSTKNIFKILISVFALLACIAQHPTYTAIFGVISFTIILVAVAFKIDDK